MKHALIVGGRVVEVFEDVEVIGGVEFSLRERFQPEFVARLVPYDPADPPPEPEPESPSVPGAVTMRQARLALLAAGKLQAVSDAIAALPSLQKDAAQIEWEFAATVERASPFLASLSVDLDLDEAELDALFVAAAQL